MMHKFFFNTNLLVWASFFLAITLHTQVILVLTEICVLFKRELKNGGGGEEGMK